MNKKKIVKFKGIYVSILTQYLSSSVEAEQTLSSKISNYDPSLDQNTVPSALDQWEWYTRSYMFPYSKIIYHIAYRVFLKQFKTKSWCLNFFDYTNCNYEFRQHFLLSNTPSSMWWCCQVEDFHILRGVGVLTFMKTPVCTLLLKITH